MRVCCRCQKELPVDGTVGRKEACPFCRSDLHVCLNCHHYDLAYYNQCRETQAERVIDKDRANFCDFFIFPLASTRAAPRTGATATKNKLAELFKK